MMGQRGQGGQEGVPLGGGERGETVKEGGQYRCVRKREGRESQELLINYKCHVRLTLHSSRRKRAF